jgi:hypothetical protein
MGSGLLLACAPIADANQVGRILQQEFTRKTQISVHSVECPPNIESKAGEQFACRIYAQDNHQLLAQVTLKNDQADDIAWFVPEGLINLAVIEENIEEKFKTQRLTKVQANCKGNKGKFKIVEPGNQFHCQVQEANDITGTVKVKVTDKQGRVNFQLVDQPITDQPAIDRPSTR